MINQIEYGLLAHLLIKAGILSRFGSGYRFVFPTPVDGVDTAKVFDTTDQAIELWVNVGKATYATKAA